MPTILRVAQFGFMDYRVVGPGCTPSESRRSYHEAVILMHTVGVRNLMHG